MGKYRPCLAILLPLYSQLSCISCWFQREAHTPCFRSHNYAWSTVPFHSFHPGDFPHTYDHGEVWGELASEWDHGPVIRTLFLTWLSKYPWQTVVLTNLCHLLRSSPTLTWDSNSLVTLCWTILCIVIYFDVGFWLVGYVSSLILTYFHLSLFLSFLPC